MFWRRRIHLMYYTYQHFVFTSANTTLSHLSVAYLGPIKHAAAFQVFRKACPKLLMFSFYNPQS